jgi:hypothetical protein
MGVRTSGSAAGTF